MAVVLIAPQTWSAKYAGKDCEKRYDTPLEVELEKAQRMVADGKGGDFMAP